MLPGRGESRRLRLVPDLRGMFTHPLSLMFVSGFSRDVFFALFYVLLAVLGPRCCMSSLLWTAGLLSSCGGFSSGQGSGAHGLSCSVAGDLPGPGMGPVPSAWLADSPATGPPGKPPRRPVLCGGSPPVPGWLRALLPCCSVFVRCLFRIS